MREIYKKGFREGRSGRPLGRGGRIVVIVVVAFFVVGIVDNLLGTNTPAAQQAQVSPSPSVPAAVAATGSTVPFQITSPTTGTTATSDAVTVAGTAPAGATVTNEVLFAEVLATADGAGRWSMVVKLTEGVNNLTFQLNNDQSARIHLQLSRPAATVAPTPTPARPTPTPPARSHDATVANVTASILDHKGDFLETKFDNLTVALPEDGGLLVIVKPNFMLNEADVIRVGGADALVVSKSVFGWYASIKYLHLEVDVDFVDSFGKTATGVGGWLEISAPTAKKFDYVGMAVQPGSSVWCDADGYYVAQPIWTKLNSGDRGCIVAANSN